MGSYQRIEAGQTIEAFQFLTGCPTFNYVLRDYEGQAEKFWRIIENADKSGFIMTCAIVSSKEGQSSEQGADLPA